MTSNVYDKAREVIKERGWRQGGADAAGPACILGAIAIVKGATSESPTMSTLSDSHLLNFSWSPPERPLLEQIIGEQFPDEPSTPVFWNDWHGRTAADVDLVLDKAARAYDEQVRP